MEETAISTSPRRVMRNVFREPRRGREDEDVGRRGRGLAREVALIGSFSSGRRSRLSADRYEGV
jgi:hypothetical protein